MTRLKAVSSQAAIISLLAAAILFLTSLLLYKGMEDLCLNRAKDTLLFEAAMVTGLLEESTDLAAKSKHFISELEKLGAIKSRRWIILQDRSGRVLWSSLKTSRIGAQLSGSWMKPAQKEKSQFFWWIKSSSPKGTFFAITKPLKSKGQVTAWLTLAMNAKSMSPLSGEFFFVAFWLLLIFVLFGILLNRFLSRRLSQDIKSMMEIVEALPASNSLQQAAEAARRLKRLKVNNYDLSMLKDLSADGFQKLLHHLGMCNRQLSKLELLFNNMKEAVFLLDEKKRVVAMNRAAETITAVQHRAAEGRPFNVLFRDLKFKGLIDRVYKEARDKEFELSLYTGDEGLEKRYYLVRLVVLKDGQAGGLSGVLVVMDDRTRIKSLEESRRRFVANVSHELKTPITAIKGYVETLQDGVGDRETEEKFLSIVARQVDRLENLVEDILTLSRIEASQQHTKVKMVECQPCRLIQRAIETCRLQAERKSISLVMDCDETIRCRLDSFLMEQAVSNLIINAINYSPENTQVMVKAYRQGGLLRIDVIDKGVGIHKKDIKHIFERFYRADKARSRQLGGTGLGLAIVKHIIQIHRGRIKVKSEPGKGSTFSLLVPLDL